MRSRFRPYRRLEQINALIALPLAVLMVPLPVVAQSAPVVAPNSGNTRVYTTPSGVPVEEIATANAAGLSHNKFTSYDVPTQGLVVNNAAPTEFSTPSQLAGSVTTNFNLKDPATVILNEVVAPNASTIAGFTEIVGGKADLIVANPYGIAVKGAGFINTDQVTLATATPILGSNGALAGLRVGGGELSISGTGLNASNVNLLNLLARSIKVGGQVNGKDMLVAAGANDFDYANRTVKANGEGGTKPDYAIDSSALGGMYANRIRLLATDVGVGVRMLGDAAATVDDVTLTSAGKVELANKTYAERDIAITGSDVAVSGAASSVTAKRNLTLDAGTGNVTLADANLVAGGNLALTAGALTDTSATTPTSANRFAVGTVTVTTTGNATVAGSSYGSGGALTWQSGATQFSNLAAFYSGADQNAADRSLSFHATSGDLDLGTAQIVAKTGLTLTSDHGNITTAASTGAGIQAATTLTATAANAVNNGAIIIAGGNLGLQATDVTNTGTLEATQGVTLHVTNSLTNAGNAAILTSGEAGHDVALTAATLTNQGYLLSTGALNAAISGNVTNSGVLATQSSDQGGANGALTLTANALANTGTVQAAGALNATLAGTRADTLSNSGTIQAVGNVALKVGGGLSQSTSGAVLSNGAIALQSGAGAFSVNTAGRIQAATTLSLGQDGAAVSLTQSTGAITMGGGAVSLVTSDIDNAGLLQAGGALDVRVSGGIQNRTGGALLTTGTPGNALTLQAASLTNAGQLQSTGAIAVTTTGAIDNSGTVLTLDSANGGAAGAIALASTTLTNSGTVQSAGTLNVTTSGADTALTNTGRLLAQGALALDTRAGSFRNDKDALVVTNGTLTLSTATLTNAGTLQSSGVFDAQAKQVTNSGLVLSGSTLGLKIATTLNNSGTVQAADQATLTVTQSVSNSGMLYSGATLNGSASDVTNSGTIRGTTGLSLSMAGALSNSGVVVTAGKAGAAVSLAAGSLTNSGQIQSAGAVRGTIGGAILNQSAGSIVTTGSGDGGSNGDITTNSTVFANDGVVSSAGAIDVVATQTGGTAFSNTNRVQAADAISISAPTRQSNTGLVLAGGQLSMSSANGAFTVSNTGTLQGGPELNIGGSSDRVALENTGTISGASLGVTASTVSNSGTGTVQGTYVVVNATGAVQNSGKVLGSSTGTITAQTLANSGTVQGGNTVTITTSGSTNNSGLVLTTVGNVGVTAGDVTNTVSGTVSAKDSLNLLTNGSATVTVTNSGLVQAGGNIALTGSNGIVNNGNATINAGGNVTIVSGGSGFTLTNAGNVGAGTNLSIGTTSDRVALDNQTSGVLLAGGNATVNATTIANAGVIQGAKGVTLDLTGAFTQTATGSVFTTQNGANVSLNAGSVTNSGKVQSSGGITTTASGDFTNTSTGTWVTTGTGALGATAANITNNGVMQSGGTMALTAATDLINTTAARLQSADTMTITTPHQLNNGGDIMAGRNLVVVGGSSAFAVLNDGGIQAAQNFTFGTNAARATFTNNAVGAAGSAGLTTKGTIQAGGAITGYATTFDNSGSVQAANGITLDASGALTNNAAAKLFTAGDTPSAVTVTAASLTNVGELRSSGDVAVTLTGALNNSGNIVAGSAITATAATLTNSAVIQAGTTLTGTATANTGTTITNSGTLRAGTNLTLTAPSALLNSSTGNILSDGGDITLLGGGAFTATNSGVIQASNALTLGATGAAASLTNNSGATLYAGGALTAYLGNSANSGTLQAGGSGTIVTNSGATLTNNSSGKVLTGDALTIDSAGGGFAVTDAGLIQAGGLLTIGGSGRAATLTLTATDSKLFADTFAITAGAVTNNGMIMGQSGGTLTATSFYNRGYLSRFIGATGTGATTVTITGALTNEGAMHSNDALTISATSIDNTSTGGLSSLGDLTLNATAGNLHNESQGALYAAGKLTLTASASIINDESATIDTDGDFAATSALFTNQGQINIGGNAVITALTFQNVMTGAENLTRTWAQPGHIDSDDALNVGIVGNPTEPNVSTSSWYYTGNNGYHGSWFDDRSSTVYGYYYNKEAFAGISDPNATFGGKTKPLIAAANLTVTGFNSGENVGGLLTATDTLAINGRTGSSSFTNDAMNLELQKWNYQATWWYDYTLGSYDWWNHTGHDGAIDDVLKTMGNQYDYFTTGAGLKADHISVTNVGTLTLIGSTNAPSVTSKTVAGGTTASLTSAATVGHAVTLAAANAVGLADYQAADAQTGSNVSAINGVNGAGWASKSTINPSSGGSAKGLDRTGAFTASNLGSAQNAAFLNALKNATLSLGGLTLKVPTNPNGYFVASADPQAKYVVSVNSTFGIDPSTALGSDYLAKKLGLNPDRVEQRLGDPAYETYLVRQQLVDQLGTKLLDGMKNEEQQMQALMDNASSEAARLGLQLGQAPTEQQLANLGQDMVWMVDQVVGGRHVLVPQVYLSPKTRSLFDGSGSSLAGNNVDLDVGDLKNTGGTIAGKDTLSIKAKNDITNTSGTITGGDVSLKAGGNITNETRVTGNDQSTTIGKTATIGATGNLDLDAGKDIKVIGGDVKAGGDASIAAGGDIVVDTVQKKTTTRTETHLDYGIGGYSSTTTTSDVKNIGSNLDFGGNVKLKSGGDTTLAGSNLNVGGNLDTDVGGDLNVLARQDQHTVDTKTSSSGFGVGGGLYGSQTTTTKDFTGTNAGSTINVGGDANLKAGKTLTLEGSDLNVSGGGSIEATDVKVLDGKDEHRTTTTTTTTTFGVFTDSGGSAGAEASASGYGRSASASASKSTEEGSKSEAGTDRGHATLSGEAMAKAGAEGSAGATIGVRTNTTTTDTYDSTSRGSTITFGGDLKIKAKNDLTVRGSDISADGNVDLNAKNMTFQAGQDVHTSTTKSSTTTAGLNFSAEGSADASAEAGAGPMGGGAGAEANAGGEVGAAIMVQHNDTNSSEGSTTARVSTIHSGGNLTRTAENKLTDVGTDIDVGGDLNQSAKTIESLAAKNTSWSSEDSTTHTGKIGVYADAKASAKAEGSANAVGGAEGEAGAEASVSAGIKASYSYENSTSSEQSSEAVVSNIKVGGKLNSKSTEKTTLEGTNIETGGDVTLEAKSLDYKAAQNTSSSTSSETSAEATLKVGVGAGASASTEDGGSAGYGPQGSLAASGGKSNASENSSEAVTGSLNSGGKLTIKTTQDAHFEGTNLQGADDTTIAAGGNVTFDAARNTSSSSSDSFHAGGEISASSQAGSKAVGLQAEGGYSNEKENSSEAVTGSIGSGGKLKIQAGGNASFEGTDVSAGGDTSVEAKGDVTFKQATSTSSSSSIEASASLEAGGESNKSEGSSSKSLGVSAEAGYSTESEKTAKTSTISAGGGLSIKSGNDVTLQGTNIETGGDTNVSAKGNLNLTAKEESSSSFGVSGGVSVGGEKGHDEKGGSAKSSLGVEAAVEGQNDVTREGGTIKSGGNVNLSSGKDTTLVGTQVGAGGDINVAAGGTVTQKAAESSSIGGAIGLSAERSSEKKTPAGGTGTHAAEAGTGGTHPTASAAETEAKPGAAGTEEKAGAKEEEPEGPEHKGGITNLGFNASASSQGTSLKSGTGKVNVQSGVVAPKPAPAAPAPAAAAKGQ